MGEEPGVRGAGGNEYEYCRKVEEKGEDDCDCGRGLPRLVFTFVSLILIDVLLKKTARGQKWSVIPSALLYTIWETKNGQKVLQRVLLTISGPGPSFFYTKIYAGQRTRRGRCPIEQGGISVRLWGAGAL